MKPTEFPLADIFTEDDEKNDRKEKHKEGAEPHHRTEEPERYAYRRHRLLCVLNVSITKIFHIIGHGAPRFLRFVAHSAVERNSIDSLFAHVNLLG